MPIPGAPQYVGYGLGLIVLNDFYGHDGEIPGFISAMLASPAHHMTIVVVLNNSTAGGDAALALAAQLAKILIPSEPWGNAPGSPAAPRPAPAPAPARGHGTRRRRGPRPAPDPAPGVTPHGNPSSESRPAITGTSPRAGPPRPGAKGETP